MATLLPGARRWPRPLLTGAAACFLLWQALILAFSPQERGALLPADGPGASSVASRLFCGGGAPAHSGDRQHCETCILGARYEPFRAPLIETDLVIAPPPPERRARAGLPTEARAPPAPGWASSWSSRAPPEMA
jgi:hypothetical protein